MKVYPNYVKPVIDKIGVIILGILVLPISLGCIIAIAISMGRPIIFTQPRIGYKNNPFKLYKFRTMTQKTDATGTLLPDHQRLTKVGSLIRSLSLDELPQLLNILKGEMSFIGPRPLLVQYLPRYTPTQLRRHEVTPGISGWAQINGRNATTWEQRFKYDIEYVDNISLKMDTLILIKTILNIIKRKDINHSNHTPMTEFMGSDI